MRAKHVLTNLQSWSEDVNGPYKPSKDEFKVIFEAVCIVAAMEDAILEDMASEMFNLRALSGDSEAFRSVYVRLVEEWLERLKTAKLDV